MPRAVHETIEPAEGGGAGPCAREDVFLSADLAALETRQGAEENWTGGTGDLPPDGGAYRRAT